MKEKLKKFLPLLILLIGIFISLLFLLNPPKTERTNGTQEKKQLVQIIQVKPNVYPVQIYSMGRVIPAVESTIKSQVAGKIIKVSSEFIPGGRISKGKLLIKIDPRDYQLAVSRLTAQYQQTLADLSLEMGRQTVAKDELALLKRSTGRTISDPQLALRKPQLEQARANIDIAKAQLEQAKLELERTEINAPFNALVSNRNANIGDSVTLQDILATLVDTDHYWIEASIPVDQLRWIKNPKEARVQITLDGNRGNRTGEIEKITGQLNQQSRLAGLLIKVDDPIDKEPNLILGDYVQMKISSSEIYAIRISRTWLRDNDTIWVNRNNRLMVKTVEPIYMDDKHVYIKSSAINNTDSIVTSDIPIAINGMGLEVVKNK